MSFPCADAPWQSNAAYLYLLDLDGHDLAWEYLRRHPGYRRAWRRGQPLRRWGLRCCR
ncbi:DUF6499 domain-containing protein [Pseudacidovorax sp. 1753]|uniref:transcriptional regulator domain-containing protein n=1 Tax=Pseudacidovorax sp. 1753 TaxID=3156419 RepID=UPI0033956FA4